MKNFSLKEVILACSLFCLGNISAQSNLAALSGMDNAYASDVNVSDSPNFSDTRLKSETAIREWNISSDDFKSLGIITETRTVNGLTIYAAADKTVDVDANNKTLDDFAFTHRIKFGGTAGFTEEGLPLNRVIAFDVTGNTTITVMGMSSSGSADRVLNITKNKKDSIIATFPALGASITKGVYNYTGGAAKILLYSPSSGVNLYYIKAEDTPTGINKTGILKPLASIYPNPASDRVYIDYPQPVEVGIFNIAGRLVKSKMILSKEDAFNIEDLKPGAYFIKSMNDNAFAKKLIVK